VLDLNLNGKLAIDLAEAFVARQIPFLVLTGYGHRQFDVPALQKAPRLHKPVDPQELVRTLSDLVRAAD
jgi:DNA-binding response OmpR family regulator